ncbi:serine-rich adhesin for platelets-like isoform X2 [Hetaerina americana]|uniref:serine-rich adhesin for platelets-like isoform X2 n=1 Tax=Hetaerina americana TaxID=62018 RepID=UPI003A7F597C
MDRSEGAYPSDSGEKATKRTTPYSRGQATSFGFKRRTTTAVKSPQVKPETRSGASSGRASPSLSEAVPTPTPVSPANSSGIPNRPVNRFGFRGPAGNVSLVRGDKVGDTNSNEALPFAPPTPIVFAQKETRNVDRNILTESNASSRAGSNKNTPTQARLAERLTFQSKQLPRPQVPQLMGKVSPIPASTALVGVGGGAVSKGAKTAANRKMAQHRADSSESLGADSGLGMLDSSRNAGPHSGSGSSGATYSGVEAAETDTLLGVEPLATAELWTGPGLTLVSPPPPLPPLPTNPSARTLEVVLNQAGGTFELRDRGRKVGVTEEKKARPSSGLPRPVSNAAGAAVAGNVVRQRSMAYKPQVAEKDKNANSASPVPHPSPANKVTTASEPERDEGSGENEEKAWRDRSSTEKSTGPRASIVSTSEEEGCTGSGSEDQEWGHGEAMADELSDEGCVSFAGGIISSSGDEAASIMPTVPRVVHLTISPGVSQTTLHPLKTVLEKSNERVFSSSGSSASSSGGRPGSGAGVRPRPGTFPNEVTVRRQNSQLSVSTTPASSESQDSPSPTGSLSLSDGSSPGALGGGFGRSCSSGADDFLIDDEIADQPGLTFCAGDVAAELTESFSLLQPEETSATLVEGDYSKLSSASAGGLKPDDDDPTILDAGLVSEGNLEDDDLITQSKTNGTPRRRASSIGTLSPCDSITSDDLMLDFERSEGSFSVATNSAAAAVSSAASWDENAVTERLACSSLPHLLDDLCTTSECARHSSSGSSNSSRLMKEWSNLIGAHSKDNSSGGLSDGADGRTGSRQTRLLRPRASSTASEASNLSNQNTPNASPGGRIPLRTGSATSLRPPRQSNCDNEYVQIERGTYLDMFQDIVSIKTMLFKLKRVLQEAETLNPFDSSLKNGLFYHLANSDLPSTIIPTALGEGNGVSSDGEENQPNGQLDVPPSQPQEEVADMRRQVVFLQQQLEEVNRSKVLLQRQLSKCACGNGAVNCSGNTSPKKEASCNVATQTERIRPVSMGPILQSCPTDGSGGGPLVSNLSEIKKKTCESALPSPKAGIGISRRLPVSTPSKRPSAVRHWK